MPLPTEKALIPPETGWEADTLYLVDVAFRQGNPIHQSYLMVGFLDSKGQPGAYTELWNNTYDRVPHGIHSLYYLKVLKKLHTKEGF